MKNIEKLTKLTSAILLTLLFGFIADVNAACTTISRTNSSALSVLTSTKYNTDLNTVYTAVNSLDGECLQAGTVGGDALNASDFAPLLKGIKEGCKVQYTNASTLAISECLASVNGSFVTTTTDTSVSFGCTGCSAEVATTTYYVYIQTGSSGTTLTPLLLTGAPNDDGYDGTGNKVLAKFYNDGSGNIDQYSIDQWIVNGFTGKYPRTQYTPGTQGLGSIVVNSNACWFSRREEFLKVNCKFTTGTVSAVEAQLNLPPSIKIAAMDANESNDIGSWIYSGASGSNGGRMLATGGDGFVNFSPNGVYGSASNTPDSPVNGTEVGGSSTEVSVNFEVPIEGW